MKIELYVDHRSEGVSTKAVEKKKPEKIQANFKGSVRTKLTIRDCRYKQIPLISEKEGKQQEGSVETLEGAFLESAENFWVAVISEKIIGAVSCKQRFLSMFQQFLVKSVRPSQDCNRCITSLVCLSCGNAKKDQFIKQDTIGGPSWYLTSKAKYIRSVEIPAIAIFRYFASLLSAFSAHSEIRLF